MADLKLKVLMEAMDRISAPFKNAQKSTAALSKSFKEATDKLRGLEKSSANIEAFKRLQGQAKANATALAAAQEKAQALGRELAASDHATKKQERAFGKAKAEVTRLKQAQIETARETKILGDRLGAAGIDTNRLSIAQRRLKFDLDAARLAFDRESKAMDIARGKMAAMAAARSRMDKTMAMQSRLAVGGATAMAVGGAGLAAEGFSVNALRGVDAAKGSLAQMDVKDLQKVIEAGRQLEQQYAGLTTEAFVSAAYDIKSGISTLSDEGVAAMTRSASITAKATKAEIGQMTSLFATGYGIFKRQFASMEDGSFGDMFASQLSRAVQLFKTTGEGMQQALENNGATATNLGMEMSTQMAALGMMQTSMQGSEAGTGLKALAAHAAHAHEKLGPLGVAFTDQQGKMRDLADIMADLRKHYGETLTAAQMYEIQQAVGSEEAMRVIQALWGQDDALRSNAMELKRAGNEGLAFATRMALIADNDNLDAVLRKNSQNLGVLAQQIGESLKPAIIALSQAFVSVVQTIGGWVQAHPTLTSVIAGTAGALAGLVFIGGTLSVAIAGLIGPFAMARFALTAMGIQGGIAAGGLALLKVGFTGLVSVASTVFPALIAGIRAVSIAMMANPLGFIIGLVALLAAGAYYVITNWETVKAFFIGMWEGVQASFQSAWDVIMFGIKALLSPLGAMAELAGKIFGAGGEKIAGSSPAPSRPALKIASADTVATIAASPAVAAAPVHQVTQAAGSASYTINVYTQPGQNETEIARMVRAEIEKMERSRKANARGNLYDEER
ncbi:MAG: phage tail tape measure protein [Alphaproteobacteria bacterium]|nr:phage tail tape measure protein [Alphaproteobacteria bacterium]